jgi:hypothetical protein
MAQRLFASIDRSICDLGNETADKH